MFRQRPLFKHVLEATFAHKQTLRGCMSRVRRHLLTRSMSFRLPLQLALLSLSQMRPV